MLDQDSATLHIILHIIRGRLESPDTDTEILGGLDDLSWTEINAG